MKRAFYGGFSLCLLAILTIVIRHPQNNLIPARMFLYMMIWVLILCGMKAAFSAMEKALRAKGLNVEKISRAAMILYAVFYGVALYIVSLALRSHPITDYENIYNVAYKLASGQTVEDWTYFSMWTNNLGTLTILAACMKWGLLLGFSDPYYFVLALNVLQVAAVLLSIFYLSGRAGRNRAKKVSGQWLAVCIFTLWTPVWACTNAFYSDQLSFGGSIIAMALFLWGYSLRGKIKYGIIAGAGIVWGVGITAKATAAIGGVALMIAVVLAGHVKRSWKELLSLYLVMALAVMMFSVVSGRYPSKKEEYRLKAPVEYWLAMGLMGNGTYADNTDLVQGCNRSPNVDERAAFCRGIIVENWSNLFKKEHILAKTSVIFGQGDVAPTAHIYPYEENLLWQWVYWQGDYYWKYACLSTGFFYAVLMLMFGGAFFQMLRREDWNDISFMSYLTVFGLFAFLMLWEAQNKQLYNHISWMTLTAVFGLEIMEDYVTMAIVKIKTGFLSRKHGKECRHAAVGTKSTE